MALVSYSVVIRNSTDNGYTYARETSTGVLVEAHADLTLEAALDNFKANILAGASPDKITVSVIPG